MNLSQDEELEWIERYNQGELNQGELDAFEAYLRDNQDARKRFRAFMRLDAYLSSQSQSSRELEKENISTREERPSNITPFLVLEKLLLQQQLFFYLCLGP